MEIDSKQATDTSSEGENTAGWKGLYIVVIVALVAQIAFYSWLTQAFA
jgi:hypothetical protein